MATARAKAKGGRPSKHTASAVLALVAGVRRGLGFAEAAREAGIGRSTAFRWVQADRAGEPDFAGLVEALRQAKRDHKAEVARDSRRQIDRFIRRLFRKPLFW